MSEVPPAAPPRRRLPIWRLAALLLALLVAGPLVWSRYGPTTPSAVRTAKGSLQSLQYPSAFGSARPQPVGPGIDRILAGGFGKPVKRGPRVAVEALLRMTRTGGLLFEVRRFASPAERDYLLTQPPYHCQRGSEGALRFTAAGVEARQTRRSFVFSWLPAPVILCGNVSRGAVLSHVSGFLTERAFRRDGEQLRAMLKAREVDWDAPAPAAEGCRLNTAHAQPLYVKFRSEELAQARTVSQQSIEWIDLPFRGDESVGRFTPETLEAESAGCAEAQSAFEELHSLPPGERAKRDAEYQNAHHAFSARCRNLFSTLRFFGAEKLDPAALPRPAQGWTHQLSDDYVPAMCPEVEGTVYDPRKRH